MWLFILGNLTGFYGCKSNISKRLELGKIANLSYFHDMRLIVFVIMHYMIEAVWLVAFLAPCHD